MSRPARWVLRLLAAGAVLYGAIFVYVYLVSRRDERPVVVPRDIEEVQPPPAPEPPKEARFLTARLFGGWEPQMIVTTATVQWDHGAITTSAEATWDLEDLSSKDDATGEPALTPAAESHPPTSGGCVVIANPGQKPSGSKAFECGCLRVWEIVSCKESKVFMCLGRLIPNR